MPGSFTNVNLKQQYQQLKYLSECCILKIEKAAGQSKLMSLKYYLIHLRLACVCVNK